ncbi:hypothetical protein BO86DRAFT_127537 [Aspergillus japonicus CBS 114.51]|uniref:Uncharacterized protein n=1 Tax=Aspergillus japonicus CBS 114.51 TaxID=1448312 RepID=A0A8T8WXF4_ASPJA|nr:hypothetical protein BO86DRAFT_127537 [Aspergillus japonicus CBS 114.51]RAH80556.1 hypothetical protein BO86DRAFT_127537 [Aspergillus japonicus CBS 114.51]
MTPHQFLLSPGKWSPPSRPHTRDLCPYSCIPAIPYSSPSFLSPPPSLELRHNSLALAASLTHFLLALMRYVVFSSLRSVEKATSGVFDLAGISAVMVQYSPRPLTTSILSDSMQPTNITRTFSDTSHQSRNYIAGMTGKLIEMASRSAFEPSRAE